MEHKTCESTATGLPSSKENTPSTSHENEVQTKNLADINTQELDQSVNNRDPGNIDFTQKLVAMWFGDATCPDTGLLSKEVQENSIFQKCQQRRAEGEACIRDMQHKVENAEKQIDNLRKSLYNEKRSKSELIEKLNTTADMVAAITDHINYITDTVERCQQHKDHLSNLYHSIKSRQRDQVGKLQNHLEILRTRIVDLQNQFESMKNRSNDLRICYENKLREKDADLANTRARHKRALNELQALVREKENLVLRLSEGESNSLDLKNDCLKYEKKVKDMTMSLVDVSGELESLKNEKLQTNNDLFSNNFQVERISNDLESTKVQLEEQLTEISSITSTSRELEEKLTYEAKEQENLTNSIKDSNKINAKLVARLEKLKEDTSECITELKKRLESVESEKTQILNVNERTTEEMEKDHQKVIKFHEEKYETRLAEIKALEAHYESEISKMDESATTKAANADAEKCKLEKDLNSLREEKEKREQDLHRVEYLLTSHKKTELQLKQKLEQYENAEADPEMIKKC